MQHTPDLREGQVHLGAHPRGLGLCRRVCRQRRGVVPNGAQVVGLGVQRVPHLHLASVLLCTQGAGREQALGLRGVEPALLQSLVQDAW